MTEASAPVAALPSETLPKTGNPRCSVPAFLLLTPPTTLVPYSIDCLVWKVPYHISLKKVSSNLNRDILTCLPVIPWTKSLVCSLMNTCGLVASV
jgi:hypothetical protein